MMVFGQKKFKKRDDTQPSEPTPVNVQPEHPTDDEPKPVEEQKPDETVNQLEQ